MDIGGIKFIMRITSSCMLVLLLIAHFTRCGDASARIKRQHNMYSVSDFLRQLGSLATSSQSSFGGGAPSNYLAGLLQQFQGYPSFQQNYRPQNYPQNPQFSSGQSQQQQVLGFDQSNGGFGFQRPRPGFPARPGLGYPDRPSFTGGPGLSLTSALQSIARYDDARCVPRLLCEVTAGGQPGGAKQAAIPFVNRDTLVSLLTVLNFGTDSPLLVFGRAALLGYMAQGDSNSCMSAYPTCPRDPDRLVDYLNNHNGGFFRFFNGIANPEYQQQLQYQQYQQLLHYQQGGQSNQLYAPQYRDYSKNTFFPSERNEIQSRILTRIHPEETASESGGNNANVGSDHFLPTPRPEGTRVGRKHNLFKFPKPQDFSESEGNKVFINGQAVPQRYLEYDNGELPTFTLDDGQYTFVNPYKLKVTKNGDKVKTFTFPAIRVGTPEQVYNDDQENNPYIPTIHQQKPLTPVMIFPLRTGTGDLRLDSDQNVFSASATYNSGSSNKFFGTSSVHSQTSPIRKPFTFSKDEHQTSNGYRRGHAFRFPADESV